MKLRTRLNPIEVRQAFHQAQHSRRVTWDVDMVQFEIKRSLTHPHAYLIQLGTYDPYSGPANKRHYKNTGGDFHNLYAATYDEWGWFMREVFEADPRAVFGRTGKSFGYDGLADFNRKTFHKFADLPESRERALANSAVDQMLSRYVYTGRSHVSDCSGCEVCAPVTL